MIMHMIIDSICCLGAEVVAKSFGPSSNASARLSEWIPDCLAQGHIVAVAAVAFNGKYI